MAAPRFGTYKPPKDWFGKLRGAKTEQKQRLTQDAAQREAAGKGANSVILSERDVQGDFDFNRLLTTTLGGTNRPITADDLAAFRQNIRTFQRAKGKKRGITARQVIDLASQSQVKYSSAWAAERGYRSDIDKAKREITHSIPVSAVNDTLHFITNAGENSTSKPLRHHVTVQMVEWETACAQMAGTALNDKQRPAQIARWLRKQPVCFDCDCGRHRFFFRYVASIGNFNAGRKETGYPKIRNPNLRGVACKHVLRTMVEFESSGTVLNFLTRHLIKVSEYQAKHSATQRDIERQLREEEAQKKEATRIKTSQQRAEEARKKRESRAAKKALTAGKTKEGKKVPPLKKPTTRTKKLSASIEQRIRDTMEFTGMTRDEVIATLRKNGKLK